MCSPQWYFAFWIISNPFVIEDNLNFKVRQDPLTVRADGFELYGERRGNLDELLRWCRRELGGEEHFQTFKIQACI